MCKEQAPVKCRGYCGCYEGNLLDSLCPRHLSAGQRALHSTATRRTHEGRWQGMVPGLVRKGNTGHAAPALFCEPYKSSDFIDYVCMYLSLIDILLLKWCEVLSQFYYFPSLELHEDCTAEEVLLLLVVGHNHSIWRADNIWNASPSFGLNGQILSRAGIYRSRKS